MKTLYVAVNVELQELIKECLHQEFETFIKTINPKVVPERLSIIDAQQYLHLSKGTLYKMTMNKEIPFHKLGKRIFFYRQELDKWIDQYARHYKTMEEQVNEHLSYLARSKRK